MAGRQKLIVPKTELNEEPPSPLPNNTSPDSSGFGLVIWLFDHINDRKPVFLSLYQQYDLEVKVSSNHKVLNWILLVLALLGDTIIFIIYALAVIAIITGITFIFIKGTGLLEFIHPTL